MLDWLNRYAAAVQALASVFSVLATLLLLQITRQYVRLTQELAKAAREQLRFQERTAASEAAQLTTLIDVFLGSLKKFPQGEADAQALRSVVLWKSADVSTFGSLAAGVLGSRPEVQQAIERLNWLHSTVDRAQQAAADDSQAAEQFPWDEWLRHLDEARHALQAVRGFSAT
jgi:hypothetical protein